jgi:hypothetical protein
MAADHYIICRLSPDQWGIRYNGTVLAYFPEKSEAVRAAIAIASEIANAGTQAVVLGEGPGAESYPIWSSDKDGLTILR